MDKIKIDYFCNTYCDALNLKPNIRKIICELLPNIIGYYEKRISKIPAIIDPSSDVYLIKPINGYYSIEDFFLNRLMRNIWSVNIVSFNDINTGLVDDSTKGQFEPNSHEVTLNIKKILHQLDSYEKFFTDKNKFLSMKNCAIKKVIMHEFEHGLQTRYDYNLDQRFRQKYRLISDYLQKNGRYLNTLRTYDEIPKELGAITNYLSTGSHVSSQCEDKNLRTYRDVDGYDFLNEILNESESLIMSKQKNYLYKKIGNDNNYFQLINPESSNSNITNYGYMLKIILGHSLSFKLMYLDPLNAYNSFNIKYSDIFQKVYNNNKDATENFITAINDIKKTDSEESHLKLNYALSLCLAKKISNFYNNEFISNKEMIDTFKFFTKYVVTNDDLNKKNKLKHIQVLLDVRNKILKREEIFKNVASSTRNLNQNSCLDEDNVHRRK